MIVERCFRCVRFIWSRSDPLTLARRFNAGNVIARQMASRQRRLNLVQAWLTPRGIRVPGLPCVETHG